MESLLPAPLKSQLQTQLAQLDLERKQLIELLSKLDARRNAIVAMLSVYGEIPPSIESPEQSGLSSLEMARLVLMNAGRPLAMADIYSRIQATYGMPAAKTLRDMLWKRARAKNIFFKDDDRRIGLVELQAVVETVGQTRDAVA